MSLANKCFPLPAGQEGECKIIFFRLCLFILLSKLRSLLKSNPSAKVGCYFRLCIHPKLGIVPNDPTKFDPDFQSPT